MIILLLLLLLLLLRAMFTSRFLRNIREYVKMPLSFSNLALPQKLNSNLPSGSLWVPLQKMVTLSLALTVLFRLWPAFIRPEFPFAVRSVCSLLPAGFLLGVLFGPEDGDDIFLRNVTLSPNYTALQLKMPFSSFFWGGGYFPTLEYLCSVIW
jgi:hypothetical protein